MSPPSFQVGTGRERCGFKGPRAAEWLASQGILLPQASNTWTSVSGAGTAAAAADMSTANQPAATIPASNSEDGLLVARLGTAEFFLEGKADGTSLRGILSAQTLPAGVYPVLREDAAFSLSGEGVHDVLAQVCNVNFAALALESNPVIMTLMIGVAVLVVPQVADACRRYLIWCDPTFGPYVEEAVGAIVAECGGSHRRVSA